MLLRRWRWSQDVLQSFCIITIYILFFMKPISTSKPWELEYWKKNWTDCLKASKVIPQVIQKEPLHIVEICYVIYSVGFGNYISQLIIDEPPNELRWIHGNDSELFTMILTGPDAPVHFDPYEREWQHWLVGNIPGNNVKKGEVLTEYEAPGGCYGFEHHRYVFVIFKQQGRIKFQERRIRKGEKHEFARAKFSTRDFARKYNLGDPYACNFFLTDLDNLFAEENT